MEASPEVGIMQFSSGVMQVVNTYFENGYGHQFLLVFQGTNFGIELPSSPISSTRLFVTLSRMEMLLLSLVTMLFSAGLLFNRFPT